MEYDAKAIAALLDKMPTKDSFDPLLDGIKGIDEKLAGLGDSFTALTKPAEDPHPEVITDPEAALEKKGFFGEIMEFKFQGIPVGQAVVGGFAAIFASELVDGFMADMEKWQRGLVKLGIAAVAAKWGKRFLGDTGSKAVALLLTFDAIRDFTPIDSWADQLAQKITGRVTTAGLAGLQPGDVKALKNQPPPAGKESAGYYAMALGGN